MAIRGLVKLGVKIASKQTQSLKIPIRHKPWIKDLRDEPQHGSEQIIYGIHQQKSRRVQLEDGRIVRIDNSLTFLDTIESNGAATRTEPIDTRDILIFPDGKSAPIIGVEGPTDPVTGTPFLLQVYMGVKND